MRRSRIGVLVVTSLVTGASVTVGVTAPSWATAGTTTRISVSSSGVQSTDPSASQSLPTMSPDGRFVLFHSYAPDLWPGARVEVALRDRTSGTTEVVSLTDTGEPVAGERRRGVRPKRRRPLRGVPHGRLQRADRGVPVRVRSPSPPRTSRGTPRPGRRPTASCIPSPASCRSATCRSSTR
jgi:hypothetical protein